MAARLCLPCQYLIDLFDQPYSVITVPTMLINLVPVVVFPYFVGKYREDSSLHTWLIVSIFTFATNFVYGVYSYYWFRERLFLFRSGERRRTRLQYCEYFEEQGKQFFGYNPFVAFWILVLLFQFAWLIVGWNWLSRFSDETDTAIVVCTEIAVMTNLIYLLCLLMFVPFSIYHYRAEACCSVFTEVDEEEEHHGHRGNVYVSNNISRQQQQQQQQQPNRPVSNNNNSNKKKQTQPTYTQLVAASVVNTTKQFILDKLAPPPALNVAPAPIKQQLPPPYQDQIQTPQVEGQPNHSSQI